MSSIRWFCCLLVVAPLVLADLLVLNAHERDVGADGHGHHGVHHAGSADLQWEGSAEGRAYSEFNHHLAGMFVILIALSEWPGVVVGRARSLVRLILPLSMAAAGLFLLVWSDHDGWPIGTMTVAQTFLTGEWETIQHKWFGIFLLAIGTVEWLRRTNGLNHRWASFPLPALAILGGVSLFLHSHGSHPAAHKIALHHAAMGVIAITAGSSKILANGDTESRWDKIWTILVLLIGIELLMYSE